MMAGNPNWWSLNDMHHPHDHHLINSSQFHMYGAASDSSSSFSSSNITTTTTTTTDHHHIPTTQDFPVRSWSQLLLGGLGGGEEEISRFGASLFQPKKLDQNWDHHHHHHRYHDHVIDDVKQEDHQSSSQLINYDDDDHQFHESITPPSSNCNVWTSDDQYHHEVSHHVMPVSSSFSNNLFNFKPADQGKIHHHRPHNQHHSSHQCNRTSSTGGGVSKKARVQHSSPQPALKVRKEKLGDRITALHQLVSPFGKTDTASVLSEAIGYIRFHQGQIEALSFPYMRNASANTNTGHQHQQQHSVVQERNCLFPEEAGQFLNDMGMEGRGVANQEYSENSRVAKDLRSRGLCLVPISCTENVGNHHQDNGADYWAPATLGRGF